MRKACSPISALIWRRPGDAVVAPIREPIQHDVEACLDQEAVEPREISIGRVVFSAASMNPSRNSSRDRRRNNIDAEAVRIRAAACKAECSMPQKEMSKRGLMMTISAMVVC